MSRDYPALDLAWPREPQEDEVELALAGLDDHRPMAVECATHGVRVFFASERDRDAAEAVAAAMPDVQVTPLLVPDEAWAERSQASITAIRVGRIVVTPPWLPVVPSGDDVVIVIQPSMGFGTGHHASTRLCLTLLQQQRLQDQRMLDVGTGSGVLAIAAHRLGAAMAVGVDYDADALVNAEENVELNAVGAHVSMRTVDITRDAATGGYDLLTANLTGAMLIAHTSRLLSELREGGTLIVSGFQTDERNAVVTALEAAGAAFVREMAEDTWVAAAFSR
jgi:ribosomal protein L11 methyltransferase